MRAKAPGLALRLWLGLTWALQPLLPFVLKRRRARGKEDPARWREKLGYASQRRPEGRLIWLHAVGLGEVLALRGLIACLARSEPDLRFLVTSNTRASAEVFGRNLPPRTIHQFAPLDAPGPARRFLAHWRLDLSIWAEQELWPGLVFRADRAGVPLALVNARMNDSALARRQRAGALYRDVLARFAVISAQDAGTAANLATLGAADVRVDGSLKSLSPALADSVEERRALTAQIGSRARWLVASSHAADEALALAAHRLRLEKDPGAILVIVPRLPDRAAEILPAIRAAGLTPACRSQGEAISPQTQVYLADTFGELGVFFRLCPVAFVGGTMNDIEGHNPWEPALLGCAILHGPHTANFAADYAALDRAGAALRADTPSALASALADPALAELPKRAMSLVAADMDRFDELCQKLVDLL